MKSINLMKDFENLTFDFNFCRNEESVMNEMLCKVCVEKVKNLGVEFTPMKSSLETLLLASRRNVFYDSVLIFITTVYFIFLLV